jgi:hypothetical protein
MTLYLNCLLHIELLLMFSMIQEKDFLADVMNWLTALHKEEKSFAEANELHFSQLKVAFSRYRS